MVIAEDQRGTEAIIPKRARSRSVACSPPRLRTRATLLGPVRRWNHVGHGVLGCECVRLHNFNTWVERPSDTDHVRASELRLRRFVQACASEGRGRQPPFLRNG